MPPLDSLEVSISSGATNVHVTGTTLTAEFECDDRPTLLGTLAALRYLLPMVLNLEFSDPPVAATSHGRVGEVEFNWQVEWTTGMFEAVDQVTQESKVRRAWERLPLVADGGSARLRASLYYFYKACRLEQAGSGPSEFLAEILLNLAKTLEALFPASDGRGTRDSVRDNLRHLGYSESELENHFLPAMGLRDELDVAHVSLTTFTPQQLGTIFRYAEAAEPEFRELLQRVLEEVAASRVNLAPYEDKGPRREARVLIGRLAKQYGGAPTTGADPSQT